jgi:hypothetical protein
MLQLFGERWLCAVSVADNTRSYAWYILRRWGASCDSRMRVMTKPNSTSSPPVLILYGRGAEGRPPAAGFNARQADLAAKAAVNPGA